MSILEAIEDIKNSLSPAPATFFYADLNEANIDADALLNAAYPLMIVIPFIPVDNPGRSGVLKTTVELDIFFLNKKTGQATVQYNSMEIENEIIAPMRAMARQFFHKMNQHEIIDKETGGVTNIRLQPTYSALDANAHGVWAKATAAVMERITGCH